MTPKIEIEYMNEWIQLSKYKEWKKFKKKAQQKKEVENYDDKLSLLKLTVLYYSDCKRIRSHNLAQNDQMGKL